MWRLKIMYEAPNHTMPNWIALNQITQSQTMDCITKSSRETFALLKFYTVLSGNYLSTFLDNLLVLPSRFKKSKRTEHEWVLTQPSFLELSMSPIFLKKHNFLESSSVSICKQRSTQPGGPLWMGYSQSVGIRETITFNICTWKQF
jgi:hypothetical protein